MESLLDLAASGRSAGTTRSCSFRGHKIRMTPQGEFAVVDVIAATRSKVIGPIADDEQVKKELEAARKYLSDSVPNGSKTNLRRHRFQGETGDKYPPYFHLHTRS